MRDGTRTRQVLLEAAIAILGRDGPGGFSAAALAREAGVSKANVFHHFASVEEIPLAAFELLGARMIELAALRVDSSGRWIDALGESVATIVREHRGFLNAYFAFFTKALFDGELRERLRTGAEAMLAPMIAGFSEGRSKANAEAMARLLAMMIDGYALHLMIAGETPVTREAWRQFARLIDP
ncbi:MAG TPA: TetR family transcriptional regulator [Rhizomicrobium sp.]|nr:TetR family transcriptional regulator [Rhizomicrobium sp.]